MPDGAPGADVAASEHEVRIDLHCHSRYSASQWLTRELGLKASVLEPNAVYHLAKLRGMTHVTLTDNDSIEGALRLAHHEDFIIGEEVTAFFPSESLHVNVLVWGIDEARHAELRDLRFNVFELVEYLRGQEIVHALAHPVALVAGGLRDDHYLSLLTLFDVWEVRNGLCCQSENRLAEQLAASRDGQSAGRTPPRGASAGPIATCAGSDDHTGLDVGCTYTALALKRDGDLLAALRAGAGRVHGPGGSTARLAHQGLASVVGFRLDHSATSRTLSRAAGSSFVWDVLRWPAARRAAGQSLSWLSEARRRGRAADSATAVATRDVVRGLIASDPLANGLRHERLEEDVGEAWCTAMGRLLGGIKDTRTLVHDKKLAFELARAQTLVAPYLLAAGFHARQRRYAAGVRDRLAAASILPPPPARPSSPRVALFTDTFDEINGVATVLRRLQAHAADRAWPFTVVSAGASRRSEAGREVFPAVETGALDLYPGFPMALLPVLEVLRWCEDHDIEVIHAVTPGPVGLVALLLAGSLDLPLVGTYHTDLPNLGLSLTGDHLLREGLWAYGRLFYDQCDLVLYPSEATRLDLVEHRVKSRLEAFPQGVDCRQFDPLRRDEDLRLKLAGGKRLLLWVGRVSPEKGLDALAASYSALKAHRENVHLVVVGDGPYRSRLRELVPDASCLGVRSGLELAALYASADVFVFPGNAETFGLTLLEAAASGLPAVVSSGGGTEDAIIRGETALSFAPGDVRGCVTAIERLLDDEDLRVRMSRAARRFALTRTWPGTFDGLADSYSRLRI